MIGYPTSVVGFCLGGCGWIAEGACVIGMPDFVDAPALTPAKPKSQTLKVPPQKALTPLQARNPKAPARVAVPAPFPLKWPS
jgi:hypothetical protein